MGNFQSRAYDVADCICSKYYPKSKYLRPAYMSSFLMISTIGVQVFMHKKHEPDNIFSFIFLSATGANLGLQIWVSFVSGMTMIRLLPRREFSLVQSHLFPKYFFLTSFLNFASLLTFLKFNPTDTWKNDLFILGCLFSGSFLTSILNFTYFNIKTIEYSSKMREIEKLTGDENNVIGKLQSDSKIENDPEYKKTKKSFLLFHGLSASTNLLSMVSSLAQLYILSSRSFFSFN